MDRLGAFLGGRCHARKLIRIIKAKSCLIIRYISKTKSCPLNRYGGSSTSTMFALA
jgi:hypothetical protein